MAALDPIKKAAVYAMSLADNADDAARVADDWGWKGGKPGEITGTDYMQDLNVKPEDLIPRLRKSFGDMKRDDADLLMQWFADMEDAGIPRRWTGKLAKKLWNTPTGPNIPFDDSQTGLATYFQNVSDSMRPMTNDQRETFLALLPEWEGSLDELADAARSL